MAEGAPKEESFDDTMEDFITKIVVTDRIQLAHEVIEALTDVSTELKKEHQALCARMVQSLSQ